MSVEIPAGFAQVSVEHRATGDPDPWYTIWGIDAGDVPSVSVGAFLTGYRNWLEPFMGNYVTCTGAEVAVGPTPNPVRYFNDNPVTPTWVGDKTVGMLPQNCAFLVDKITMQGGRRQKGRVFFPGCLPEGDVDNIGVIGTSLMNAFQAAADTFGDYCNAFTENGVGAAGLGPYLLHSPGISPIVAPTNITSFHVQSVISTQRRRLR